MNARLTKSGVTREDGFLPALILGETKDLAESWICQAGHRFFAEPALSRVEGAQDDPLGERYRAYNACGSMSEC